MKKKIRILVTGAGSGVGQSIVKALRISKLNADVIFGDINYLNSGLYRIKKSIILPKVESKGALGWYIKNLKKLKINILMIGSEYDLVFFSKNLKEIKNKTGCLVCVSNIKTINVFNDKYLTQVFLKDNKLPFLKTYISNNIKDAATISKKLGFPLILKGRFGTSARNVFLIKNLKDLKKNYTTVKKPILQEYVGPKIHENRIEYTCSFFKTKSKKILGPIILKRKLVNGTSWITETIKNSKISKLIIKIAKIINCEGSLNIQLRVRNKGPVPFEINPRFSGTTAIRAHYGFNEPEMYIKNYYFNKSIDKKVNLKKGVCFRYIEEIFLDGAEFKILNKKIGKGIKRKWF